MILQRSCIYNDVIYTLRLWRYLIPYSGLIDAVSDSVVRQLHCSGGGLLEIPHISELWHLGLYPTNGCKSGCFDWICLRPLRHSSWLCLQIASSRLSLIHKKKRWSMTIQPFPHGFRVRYPLLVSVILWQPYHLMYAKAETVGWYLCLSCLSIKVWRACVGLFSGSILLSWPGSFNM